MLIQGNDIAYTGSFTKGTQLTTSYIPQETFYLSGDLNTFIAKHNLPKSLMRSIMCKVGFSRYHFDIAIENYSEGLKKKLLLASSLCSSDTVALWDEPLNYIDIPSRIQIEDLLIASKPTMIFVEHDHFFCDKVATKNITI